MLQWQQGMKVKVVPKQKQIWQYNSMQKRSIFKADTPYGDLSVDNY